MNVLIQKSSAVNGLVSGRGLAHRKLDPDQNVALAADVATGERPFQPSLAQISLLFGVSLVRLREELKARAAAAQELVETLEPLDPIEELTRAWKMAPANDREWFLQAINGRVDAIAGIIR